MPRYRITVSNRSREAMLDLAREFQLQVFDHGIRGSEELGYTVDAMADDEAIAALQARDYKVERHEDVDEAGRERQREVGQGNRYATGSPS